MNNRLLFALPLAAVLAFPAVAQTTSPSTDQSAPAATTQSTSTSTDAAATGKAPLAPPSREGFWGRVNPFARKTYVKRQTEPIRDRVNELDELTSQNGKAIKDTDARAQAGIKLASDKADVADQHAVDAGNKATAAQQSAQQVTTRVQTVETVVGNIDQYKASNQTEIRFRPGQTVLSKNAKDALDTDGHRRKGSARLHHRSAGLLFRQRTGCHHRPRRKWPSRSCATSSSTTRFPSIASTSSAWATLPHRTDDASNTKRVSGGRVEISLLKNDLEQLSANSGAPATSTDQPQQPK